MYQTFFNYSGTGKTQSRSRISILIYVICTKLIKVILMLEVEGKIRNGISETCEKNGAMVYELVRF